MKRFVLIKILTGTSTKILLIISILPSISCSTFNVIKSFNKGGYIKEIKILEKDKLRNNIVIEYDKKNRIIKVINFIPSREKPVWVRRFRYNSRGYLRLQYFKGIIFKGNKTTRDIWVESFFYNRTKHLIRVETAYKSSYSISRNKTPYMSTRFNYHGNRLERIRINGGTFRKELTIQYTKDSLTLIRYTLYALKWKPRRFKLQKDLHFYFKNSLPVRIDDKLNKTKITSTADIRRIFQKEEIHRPIRIIKYSFNISHLVDSLVKRLTRKTTVLKIP